MTGRFDPEVADVQLLADGRKATLLKTFRYTDGEGKPWEAPAGTAIDGASIPQMFWSIIGGPYEGKYRFASIVHDRYCVDHGGRTWKEVHRMFHHACLAGGTDPQLAKLMYAAVYHFGPRWSDEDKGVDELAALIPPERARIAEALETVQPARAFTTAATRARTPDALTEQQYRDLVLAPRPAARRSVAMAAGNGATVDKWDRIRDFVRAQPDATLEQVEQVQ
jgi:hypothetical protein